MLIIGKYIRHIILISSIVLSGVIYLWVPRQPLAVAQLNQVYGLLAVLYLYIALLTSPLTQIFPKLPWRGHYLRARRAIGVSAAYFALLHACFSFWGQLGGFHGLPFLNSTYLWAITLSFTALLILLAMASTSFNAMVSKLGHKRWKFLHRFVYLAGILILTHVVLIGSHFSTLSQPLAQITVVALAWLFILEAIRFDRYLQTKRSTPQYGATFVVVLLLVSGGLYSITHQDSRFTFSSHSHHGAVLPSPTYDIQTELPITITPNTPTHISFSLHSSTQASPPELQIINEQLVHLIIVDSELKYFNHVHPTATVNGFTTQVSFPHDGQYHAYVDFQPVNDSEQVRTFIINVGTIDKVKASIQAVDVHPIRIVDGYEVSLHNPDDLRVRDIMKGQQLLHFEIHSTEFRAPVTDLEPYLGSVGHLVMINQATYEYIHVHPVASGTDSGPVIEFLPMNMNESINPGIYRLFLELKPGGQLLVTDFTIKIEP